MRRNQSKEKCLKGLKVPRCHSVSLLELRNAQVKGIGYILRRSEDKPGLGSCLEEKSQCLVRGLSQYPEVLVFPSSLV